MVYLNSSGLPKDKQYHLAAGIITGSWSYTIGIYPDKNNYIKPVIFNIAGATFAGLTKESYDKLRGSKFDTKDLGYTIAGGIISSAIITGLRQIHFSIKRQSCKNVYHHLR